MKALLPATALALAVAITAGSAGAQTLGGSSARPAPWVQTGDAAYPPPPGAPPAGTHYEWIFSYDRHGNYLGHWQVVRDR